MTKAVRTGKAAKPAKTVKPAKAAKPVKAALSHYEIERKYRTTGDEQTAIAAKLSRHDFELEMTSIITDTLLPAPKSETLRIRREQIVDEQKPDVRYLRTHKKHPLLPNGTHVREEEELAISLEEADREMTQAMHSNCAPLPSYSKVRRSYTGTWKGLKLTVCLDVAQGLCSYSGHYIEIEALLPVGSKKINKVQAKIVRFAQHLLGDKRAPVISYRKMLLLSIAGSRGQAPGRARSGCAARRASTRPGPRRKKSA